MIKHNVRSCILSAILASCSLVPSYNRPSPPPPASYPGVTGTQVSVDIEQHFWSDFFAEWSGLSILFITVLNYSFVPFQNLTFEDRRESLV